MWKKPQVQVRMNLNYHPSDSHVQPCMDHHFYETRLGHDEGTRQMFDFGCFPTLAPGLLVIKDRRLA